MERILITGGAGFIGSRVARALVEKGYEVRILDSLIAQVHGANAKISDWLRKSCDFRFADIRDRAAVNSALADVGSVVHLAAETGPAQSMYEIERYCETNQQGTAILLQGILARQRHVKKIVVASSRAIYGEGKYRCASCGDVYPEPRSDERLRQKLWEPVCPACGAGVSVVPTDESSLPKPTSIYAVTKLSQEQMCLAFGRSYGIPTVALRYQNVYGGGQSLTNPYIGVLAIFAARIKSGSPLGIYEDGEIKRDFVHVDDAVDATVRAVTAPLLESLSLNVGSGVPATIREVAGALCDAMARQVAISVTGQYRAGDIRHCYADLRRAREVLGYAPKVTLAAGLKDLAGFAQNSETANNLDQATAELESRGLFRS